MKGGRARTWARQVRAASAFVEVVRVADSVNVALLPVKGVLTARQLYADPADRPMVDVDVRVRPRDLARLCAEGRRAGWEPLERSWSWRDAAFGVQGQRVEIETHIGPPGLCRLSIDELVGRATRHVEPFGVPHLQPEVHDHAILLMVNVFKDKLANASDFAWSDLARIARGGRLSFERLAERARDAGVSTIAWVVAGWMIDVRKEPSWTALRDALGHRAPRPLYAAAFRALVRPGKPPSLPLRMLARAGSDSPVARARALSATACWSVERLVRRPRFALGRLLLGI